MIEGVLSRVVAFYARTLHVVLRFPILTLLVFFATIALTVVLYIKTPKAYFPIDDSGFVIGATRSSADTSFQSMLGLQQQLADIVMADPAVAGIGSVLGGGSTANRGVMYITLKPPGERDGLTTAQVIDRLRKNLGAEIGKFPPVPWVFAAAFVLLPLLLTAGAAPKVAAGLVAAYAVAVVLFARFDR